MNRSVLFILLALLLAACSSEQQPAYLDYSSKPSQIKTCYGAADALAEQLSLRNAMQISIIKTTFTNIDFPDRPYTNGRMYSEAIASRLSQRGFSMIEINPKLNNRVAPPKQDGVLLSPDQVELAKNYKASAALIGYYKRLPQKGMSILYVRIVNVSDNMVLASEDVSVED